MEAHLYHTNDVAENQPPKERRHVFSGYTSRAPSRSNRPFKNQNVSTFNIVLALFSLAVVSVLYVSNVIAVNQLAGDVENLRGAHTRIENENEILRSVISQKSSMERITKIANEQMGMVYPRQAPTWFELDEKPAGEATE